MLEGLFEEDESTGDGGGVHPGSAGGRVDTPPPPRLPCGLAGINNQGATCYLNSLLQTLLFTPEFRDSLFCLGENELGSLDQVGLPGAKVRVIPIHLQRLFARLLLSDQQSVSTRELTDSFGWTNNEAFQQQDVQELNRILFSAIEDSLVGTSGQNFISDLYHGNIVNQITCQECHRVSEREEDFLDLTLTVAGNGSVQDVLADCYCNTEMMDGRNQYRCERCNKLVDAKKGAKLRSLPTILTLSLLRFSFDFQKMERYKEAGRMAFPLLLDMSPYVEKPESSDSSVFELFSVVIHRGGAYGGHYHAYIRDVDGFGNWTHPDEEEIRLPIDPSTGSVDYLEVDSPVEMVTALLSRAGKQGLSMDKLCSEMTKQTGVSWNKRFKKHYGPINKFLKKYEEHFDFDQTRNWIQLKTASYSSSNKETRKEDSSDHEGLKGDNSQLKVNSSADSKLSDSSQPHVKLKENPNRPVSPAPAPGYCWFDFDDSRVHPIREKEIDKQFSGKASAYMLFYRRVSTKDCPIREQRNIPENLVSMVIAENEELHKKRKEYEEAFNTITVQVHLGSRYEYRMGALHPQDSSFYFIEVTLDRRKTLLEFTHSIHETGEIIPDAFTLHRLKTLPSGGHLYEEIPIDEGNMMCKDCGILNGDQFFLWDGHSVLGEKVPMGQECEPICLTVIYGNPHQMTRGFPKNLLLAEFKVIIGDLLQLETCDLDIQRLVSEGIGVKAVEIKSQELDVTLESLKLKDGDELVVSQRGSQGSCYPDVLKSLSNSHNTSQFTVENRCIEMSSDCSWPVFTVEVDKDATVGELKLTALSKAGVGEVTEGGRLRVDHTTLGLKPPLYEGLTLTAAHLAPGTRLVLEPGAAPLNNEMTLTFEAANLKDDNSYMELTIDKTLPVGMCLSLMIDKAGFTGDAWHLRKTNWCGEAADVLDDMEISVEEATLHHGDHVLLEPGKLPPKGVLRLAVSLYPSPHSALTGADNSTGMISWITQGIQGLLGGPSPAGDTSSSPMNLQDVEISKEATLEDLKLQVMTLPEVAALPIPTPDYIRLRLVNQGRLSTVLKGSAFTLQRLKLKSDCHIAVQPLPWEETLTQNHLVLWVQQRLPDVRGYGPAVEFVWDASQGPSAANLRTVISELCQIPKHRLTIAKHFTEKFEWLVLHDINKKPGSKKGKKKFLAPKSNMKNSPYFLKDGDVIGVKDLEHGADKGDFGTEEDDRGKERLSQEANEKHEKRQEKKRMQTTERVCTVKRPEVGLHIKVDKFT